MNKCASTTPVEDRVNDLKGPVLAPAFFSWMVSFFRGEI